MLPNPFGAFVQKFRQTLVKIRSDSLLPNSEPRGGILQAVVDVQNVLACELTVRVVLNVAILCHSISEAEDGRIGAAQQSLDLLLCPQIKSSFALLPRLVRI